MSLFVRGMGWVTPLGTNVSTVWRKLLCGTEAPAVKVESHLGLRDYQAFRVEETPAAHPRLRRSSNISRFAVAAGLAALADAGIDPTAEADRIALIFATANGGVIYTKRFYHDIVTGGARQASPLLFPETVFNAPASHLAAIMGINGASYTLVGDGAVGLLALKMAEDLMRAEALDHCLVVAAEEVDWLLCDAYRKWRLLRDAPPLEILHQPPRGMILSEGAGALLLSRSGKIALEQISAGGNYWSRDKAAALLSKILEELGGEKADLLVSSANGTFIDAAEQKAAHASALPIYSPKPALGEAVSAGGLWQVIIAAQALQSQQLPPQLHDGSQHESPLPLARAQRALVLTCGLNEQAAGLRLGLAG